jgi:hypothetical protein
MHKPGCGVGGVVVHWKPPPLGSKPSNPDFRDGRRRVEPRGNTASRAISNLDTVLDQLLLA